MWKSAVCAERRAWLAAVAVCCLALGFGAYAAHSLAQVEQERVDIIATKAGNSFIGQHLVIVISQSDDGRIKRPAPEVVNHKVFLAHGPFISNVAVGILDAGC